MSGCDRQRPICVPSCEPRKAISWSSRCDFSSLTPARFSLGQHDGLERAVAELQAGEELLAYLDDLYVITSSRRAREGLDLVASRVQEHCGIASNVGKTRVYNAGHGAPSPGTHELGDWRSAGSPRWACPSITRTTSANGGADAYGINRHSWTTCRTFRTCGARGSCCSCAAARGPTMLVVQPYAEARDRAICATLWAAANRSLPRPGRLSRCPGLQSAVRTAPAAYWGAWADSLGYLDSRCPNLARACSDALARGGVGRPACARHRLRPICWAALTDNVPAPGSAGEAGPGDWPHGWQFHASRTRTNYFRERVLLPTLEPAHRAVLLSHHAPTRSDANRFAPPGAFCACRWAQLLAVRKATAAADGLTLGGIMPSHARALATWRSGPNWSSGRGSLCAAKPLGQRGTSFLSSG